jgi:Endopolygalacturonase
MLKKFSLLPLLVLSFVATAFSQNRFEGNNILLDVPENQRSAACAIRYVPPTTEIRITDLDTRTPMKISQCPGSGSNVTQSGSTAIVRANPSTYKWCFQGEDKRYRISFTGDQISGNAQIVYNWIATPETPGVYNVKDFGAVGDGSTDDTIAIKSALAFITTRNGGTLQFPEGDFIVTSPIVLPSGIVIQGVGSIYTKAPTNNINQRSASRIRLRGTRRSIFRIGECTERVTVRDIELYADSTDNTVGVEAVGAYNSSQDIFFERVVFNNFHRGIYVRGLPQTNYGWQCDFIKVKQCRFIYNTDAGIYSYARNSAWKIEGSFFLCPQRTASQRGDAMTFWYAGLVQIQDTFGGGVGVRGGAFINVVDNSVLTVMGSQAESMTHSFVYNDPAIQYHGDYSYPVTFINNIFGDPIEFKGRRTFVSTGNLYGPKTFIADPSVRVYSTGDRFCYDGNIVGCQSTGTRNNFDRATLVMMTAQPTDGSVQGHPTFFGTDVQFGAPVQLPNFMQNQLPAGKSNGSMVYCTNCRRNTTPCQAGGNGAPAMVVGGQWSCL